MFKKLVFALALLVLALVCIEGLLRMSGAYLTFHERDRGTYTSYWGHVHASHIWSHSPGATFTYENAEFDYEVAINREGVRDRDHEIEKPKGMFRIVMLGDSCTEGLGAPFEKVWWNVLGQSLREKGYPVEIISGGVSGNDIFYEYKLLEERLLKYSPDLVMIALNESDQADWIYRGGFERFHDDGTTRYRTGPWYEPIYQHVHLFRFVLHSVMGYGWQFLSKSAVSAKQAEAFVALADGLTAFKDLGTKSGFRFCVMLHPTGSELLHGYQTFQDDFLRMLNERDLNFINTIPAHHANPLFAEHTWPINQHLDGEGNLLFADVVEPMLIESGLLPQPGAARP